MAKDQKHDDPEYQARSVALRLLARREHSRYELAIKLRQRKIPPDVFDPVLDEYEREGWLDDDRFAEIYSRQRIEAGYGPLRILAELQQRGVNQAPECLSSVAEEEWCRRAVPSMKVSWRSRWCRTPLLPSLRSPAVPGVTG